MSSFESVLRGLSARQPRNEEDAGPALEAIGAGAKDSVAPTSADTAKRRPKSASAGGVRG